MKVKTKSKSLADFNRAAFSIYNTAKITREQAKQSGLLFYWPEEPCMYGHITYRYAKGNGCRCCAAEAANARASSSVDKIYTEEFKYRHAVEELKYERELRKLEEGYYDYGI